MTNSITPERPSELVSTAIGDLAVTRAGQGPLVVCIPGVGDLAAEYRFLTPHLIAAGRSVATIDLPGHGHSPVPDSIPTRAELGRAVVEVARTLADGDPVDLIGCSLGASAAAIAAAADPGLTRSVTLIGPFLRDADPSALQTVMKSVIRMMLWRPIGAGVWASQMRRLMVTPPDDVDVQLDAVRASLRDGARLRVMREMALSSCDEVEAALAHITCPSLIVMGDGDTDWADPAAEARWAAEATYGRALMVADAGHYPHVEHPDHVAAEIITHLDAAAVQRS